MLRKFQTPVGLMVLLAMATMLGFIAMVVTGKLESFIDGVIVEMFGALLTAGAIIGLEQILTFKERLEQQQEIARLHNQLKQQSSQLTALLDQLRIQTPTSTDSIPPAQQ